MAKRWRDGYIHDQFEFQVIRGSVALRIERCPSDALKSDALKKLGSIPRRTKVPAGPDGPGGWGALPAGPDGPGG